MLSDIYLYGTGHSMLYRYIDVLHIVMVLVSDKLTSMIAICPSHCQTEYLKTHFTHVFGMVSVDSYTTPTLAPNNSTRKGRPKIIKQHIPLFINIDNKMHLYFIILFVFNKIMAVINSCERKKLYLQTNLNITCSGLTPILLLFSPVQHDCIIWPLTDVLPT